MIGAKCVHFDVQLLYTRQENLTCVILFRIFTYFFNFWHIRHLTLKGRIPYFNFIVQTGRGQDGQVGMGLQDIHLEKKWGNGKTHRTFCKRDKPSGMKKMNVETRTIQSKCLLSYHAVIISLEHVDNGLLFFAPEEDIPTVWAWHDKLTPGSVKIDAFDYEKRRENDF